MVNVQPVTFKDNLVPLNFLGQSPRSALVGSLFSFLCSQQFLHHRRISFCTGLWPLLWVLFLLIAKPYSDLGISRLHMYLRTLTARGRHIPAFVLCKSFFWLPITQFLAVLPHSAALLQQSFLQTLASAQLWLLLQSTTARVFTVPFVCYFSKPCRSFMFSHQKGCFFRGK